MELDTDNLVELLSEALFRKHAIEAIVVSAVALQVYDWLLTLPHEVKYIWRARWNWSKALYLLTRYTPFANVLLGFQSLFALNASPESCRRILQASIWLSFAGLAFAEAVLMLRTYAVWNRDKRVGIGLGLLFILCQTAAVVTMEKSAEKAHLIQNPHPEIIRGCVSDSGTKLLLLTWVIITIEEGVDLALMIISALKTYHEHRSNLMKVIYRDGIRFYLCIFFATLANVLTILLLPIDFVTVGSTFEIVLHSILACRLMIGIREASQSCGRKSETFELSVVLRDDTIEFARMSSDGGESAWMDPEAYAGPPSSNG